MRSADPEENEEAILTEVAEAMGYEDKRTYNDACRNNPREVLDRIYALEATQ